MGLAKAFKILLAGLAMVGAVGFLAWRVVPVLNEEKRLNLPATPRQPMREVPIDQKIEAIGLNDLDGRPVTTAELVAQGAGKPIVVAFWSIT